MAVRPRVSAGSIDLGDVKAIVEEVAEENEQLYDLTFQTMIETFTEPLSGQEIEDIVSRLDLQTLAGLVAVDPEGARKLLQTARAVGE